MFDASKYRYYYYKGKNDGGKATVCAISTYAGKDVKGYAKCHPDDTFEVEQGMELAAARCNARIARKRKRRAAKKQREAEAAVVAAQRHLSKMIVYYCDAAEAVVEADTHIEKLLEKM